MAFVECVAAGGTPVRDMVERFNLTPEQASKRSWRLRKSGWLPAGHYATPGWLEQAQAMVDERLDALMERELRQRAQLAKRLERTHNVLQRRRKEMTRLPAQVRPARPTQLLGPAAPSSARRESRRDSVLDIFG